VVVVVVVFEVKGSGGLCGGFGFRGVAVQCLVGILSLRDGGS
jgi:hypothetical protein